MDNLHGLDISSVLHLRLDWNAGGELGSGRFRAYLTRLVRTETAAMNRALQD